MGEGQNGKYAMYTLACQHSYKNKETGEYGADFVKCASANEKIAQFIEGYLHKGTQVIVEGSLKPKSKKNEDGTYNNDYSVRVFSHEFVGSKKDTERAPETTSEGFAKVDDNDSLPF